MAINLYLKRFKTWNLYKNTQMEDGTFFVIVESGQLGVRRGDVDILTPPNTLRDYELPAEGSPIKQSDTIFQAIGKLEKRLQNLGDTAEEAINAANTAITAIQNLEYTGETDPDIELRLSQLESKITVLSESEYEAMGGFDPNKIYYVYEND